MNEGALDWNMTIPEAETYRIAKIWENEIKKATPKNLQDGEWYRRNHLPETRDPRKSSLFRQCWKLRRETNGLLKGEEYRLYIIANIVGVKSKGGRLIPDIMCGEKAWIRWKIWKRNYEKKQAEENNLAPPPSADPKIMRDLMQTKRWIFEKCDGEPSFEKFTDFCEKGIFKLWILQGKVSIYYVVLSPFVNEACSVDKLSEECHFDRVLYEKNSTDDVRAYFEYEFLYEFKN